MNPYGITPDRLTRDDQIEIHRQWVAVQRSIDEYWRAPITTGHPLRDYCKNRHRFTPENTRMDGGAQTCRTCERANRAKRRQQRKAA